MSSDLLTVVLGVTRVLGDGGFVLLTGVLAFTSIVSPRDAPSRRAVRLAALGIALLVAATVAGVAARLVLDDLPVDQALSPDQGAALLIRLAALAAAGFFLVDLAARPVVGWRRVVAWLAVVVIAVSISAESAVSISAESAVSISAESAVSIPAESEGTDLADLAVTGLHVLATGVWLGTLVVLVAMGSRRWDADLAPDLREMLPRCHRLTLVAIVALVLSGIGSTFLLPDLTTAAIVLLVIKSALLVGVLLARRRALTAEPHVAVRVELGLAVAALVATSVLVAIT